MIDEEGERLYVQTREVLEAIRRGEEELLDIAERAMNAFDKYMNALNKTTGILYSKKGNPLMKW